MRTANRETANSKTNKNLTNVTTKRTLSTLKFKINFKLKLF